MSYDERCDPAEDRRTVCDGEAEVPSNKRPMIGITQARETKSLVRNMAHRTRGCQVHAKTRHSRVESETGREAMSRGVGHTEIQWYIADKVSKPGKTEVGDSHGHGSATDAQDVDRIPSIPD